MPAFLAQQMLWPETALAPWPGCSIDPPGCTDVDDALSVRWLPWEGGGGKGGAPPRPGGRPQVEVGVHIADVSYFVRQVRAEQGSEGTSK